MLPDASRVEATGSLFPVDVQYIDPRASRRGGIRYARGERSGLLDSIVQSSLQSIVESGDPGDVLVFLPGIAEITRLVQATADLAQRHNLSLHPLHGTTAPAEQRRALRPDPHGRRKVIFSTNVAETSVTIDGVRHVIDTGLERAPKFDPASGLSRLEIRTIARDSADQRAGRAGRTAPGTCYRLWSRYEHGERHTAAESAIMQADLAPLALSLAEWGTTDAESLLWLDPPPRGHLAQARTCLHSLGLIDDRGHISALGTEVAALPLHPRLGAMVARVRAHGNNADLALACDLSALLILGDPLAASARRGAIGIGVTHRLDALTRERADTWTGGHRERLALQRVLRESNELRRIIGLRSASGQASISPGAMLAHAYPDRLARQRRSRPNGAHARRYVLASGIEAELGDAAAGEASEFLVVADIRRTRTSQVIALAASIEQSTVETEFSHAVQQATDIQWDPAREGVERMIRRSIGRVVLDEHRAPAPDSTARREAIVVGIRSIGLHALPWSDALVQWRERVMTLRALFDTQHWPDVSNDALMDSLEEWLTPYLGAVSRRSQFARIPLADALASYLGWDKTRELDRLAPSRWRAPSGSVLQLHYRAPDPPHLKVKLQEMLGCRSGPTIADQRIAVVIELLSPAMRPIQTTSDLESFWKGSYAAVRKEMRGRYPKHQWPLDPLDAAPTRNSLQPRGKPGTPAKAGKPKLSR
jgi:ATP-dependent helicase HrpB